MSIFSTLFHVPFLFFYLLFLEHQCLASIGGWARVRKWITLLILFYFIYTAYLIDTAYNCIFSYFAKGKEPRILARSYFFKFRLPSATEKLFPERSLPPLLVFCQLTIQAHSCSP